MRSSEIEDEMNAIVRDDQRIAKLIDASKRALAQGRTDEAANLVRQAELESPQHPLVLNEIGQRLLLSGNLVRARELFEQASRNDSSNPSIWINLAAALRGLGRRD
jgi:Flp pilus assembly protein TadD